ncbi:MAG: SpaA isopeptide-forming pilin-related protein [Eubacteriales bacterium]|nr:SpaA isopeptide-forming pilin-related protein [Eubacteriales bacterium]
MKKKRTGWIRQATAWIMAMALIINSYSFSGIAKVVHAEETNQNVISDVAGSGESDSGQNGQSDNAASGSEEHPETPEGSQEAPENAGGGQENPSGNPENGGESRPESSEENSEGQPGNAGEGTGAIPPSEQTTESGEEGESWETVLTEEDTEEETTEMQEELLPPAGMMTVLLGADEELTLQQQIDAAEDGVETLVQMTEDCREILTIPDGKIIILDLNGYTLSSVGASGVENGEQDAVTVSGMLTLRDGSQSGGMLSGEGLDSSMRGVAVSSGGSFVLESGTIAGFAVSGNGGGVYVENGGSFEMQGGTIENNKAGRYGGGIFMYNGSAGVFENGTVQNNEAQNGGGLAIHTLSTDVSGFRSENFVIRGNLASVNGGGIYLASMGTRAVIGSCTVEENEAAQNGGGIYLAQSGTCVIDGAAILKNTSRGSGGGLCFAATGSACEIVRGTIGENRSDSLGGGISFALGSQVVMSGGEIRGNIAGAGGGIHLLTNTTYRSSFQMSGGRIGENMTEDSGSLGGGIYVNGSYAQITMLGDAVIEENSAVGNGGGIYMYTYNTFTMEGGTLCKNSAQGHGGGIFLHDGGKMTMSGGEIGENMSGGNGGGIYGSRTAITVSNAVISDNRSSGSGGGIFSSLGVVTLGEETQICRNEATTSGGGIYDGNGTVNLRGNVQVFENTTGGNGGGVWATTLNMESGIIRDNRAKEGAGLATCGGTISGGEILRNDATAGSGGGIFNVLGTLSIADVYIAENTAAENGGGIYIGRGGVEMDGGIITKNTANAGGGVMGSQLMNGFWQNGGLLYGNTARIKNGGSDFCFTKVSTKNEVFLRPANEVEIDGISRGNAWYFENEKTYVTDTAVEYDGSTAAGTYSYTFLPGGRDDAVASVDGTTYASVQEAVDSLRGDFSGKTVLMLQDSRENVVIPENTKVSLDLNGHILRGQGSSVLTVEETAELTILDATEEKNGQITGGVGSANPYSSGTETVGGGLFVKGTAALESGTIVNNRADYGGGVYVGGSGVFMLRKDGVITQNTGEGVCVNYNEGEGGAGSFLMTGGEISENTGGVLMGAANAVFTMDEGADGNSGLITANTRSNNAYGGGVLLYGGTMRLKAGAITGNQSTYGGGIYIGRTEAADFYMSGGLIAENTANAGGGIYVLKESGCTFEISGGSITHNMAEIGEGGGIYFANSTAQLQRNAVIGGLVYDNKSAGLARDIFVGNLYQINILKAADMGLEDYDCWYEAGAAEYLTEEIVKTQNRVFYLTAAQNPFAADGAARIGDTYYETIQKAVDAAGQGDIIYLLKDHTESVIVEKDIIFDMNGYTLTGSGTNIFRVLSGSLTLRDTQDQPDAKPDSEGGVLTMQAGKSSGRAVYVSSGGAFSMESGTLTGFKGVEYGGAVCLEANTSFTMSGGSIEYNEASFGGAVASRNIGAAGPVTVHMSGGVVKENYAKYGGGFWLQFTRTGVENVLEFTGGELANNEATGHGGAIYVEAAASEADQSCLTLGGKGTTMLISGNKAGIYGGGIFTTQVGRVNLMDGVEMAENTASYYGGAYIYNDLNTGKTVEMTGGIIRGNRATVGNGGGALFRNIVHISGGEIYENAAAASGGGLVIDGSEVVISGDTVIRNNTAASGAGLSVAAAQSFVMEENPEIRENKASGNGGGLLLNSCAEVCISGGIIENNSAGSYGGGLGFALAAVLPDVALEGVQIRNNAAEAGGGIYINPTKAASVEIKNSTVIAGNTTDGPGGGLYNRGSTVKLSGGEICDNISASYGGGVYLLTGEFRMEGGTIQDNTAFHATGGGGGIYAGNLAEIDISGGSICGNKAVNGGGIFSTTSSTINMSGGSMVQNTATASGGGVYLQNEALKMTMTGGVISNNTAGSYGGGIYMGLNRTSLALKKDAESGKTGQLYDNRAKAGQDIYALVSTSATAVNSLELIAASEMFGADEGRQGIGWYDESQNTVTTGEISYVPRILRTYPLTLRYKTSGKAVARIADQDGAVHDYESVQSAADAVKNGEIALKEGEVPVIVMIDDSVENVTVPGGVEMVLNLNGHTLQGSSTAITCYGNLTIRDEKTADGTEGMGTGTITGYNTALYGGGVKVCSGGYVKLVSGQISDCRTLGSSTTAYGGAGVCIDNGTFEMAGGSINHCIGYTGTAVFVRGGAGVFLMNGGVIENNTGSYIGTVYVESGTMRMTGGEIRDNNAAYGGAVSMASGKTIISGGALRNNTATTNGGALRLAGGTMQLSDVEISGNTVTGAKNTNLIQAAGGGIYQGGGTLNIYEGTIIKGNEAGRGGGIYQYSGTARMIGGVVQDNDALLGGGIAQNPRSTASFTVSGGAVYGNCANENASGNDIYSAYEGTDSYPGTNVSNVPRMTLPAAVKMGNRAYNVWKDDTYEGTIRVGETLLDGEYVTGQIIEAYGLQLTAAKYALTVPDDGSSNLSVLEVTIQGTGGGSLTDGQLDGTSIWDSCKGQEKTADDFLTEGKAKESDKTYLYNGEEYNYIEYDGKLYERAQAVEWSPGDDSGAANGIVRTYDLVTYKLHSAVNYSGEEPDGEEAADGEVCLYVEALLPCDSVEAEFVPSASKMDDYEIREIMQDGKIMQKLTGYWKVAAQPGNYERDIDIRVKGMENGETMKPVFRSWIGENAENAADPAQCSARTLTVSAAPRYNVVLLRNSELAYTGYFDLASGQEASGEEGGENVIYGTMLGYGITLELYNNSSGKGMKGIELPKGDIEFDVTLSGSLYMNGTQITDENGEPVFSAPYVWAYKENENTSYGANIGNTAYDFRMNWNDVDDVEKTTQYAYDAAPFNSGDNAYSCYSGGVWSASALPAGAEDTRMTMHFTVSGYSFDFTGSAAPSQASDKVANALFSPAQIKPFSAGYVQVIFPVDSELAGEQTGFLEINMDSMVSDLKASGMSGQAPESTEDGMDVMQEYFGYETYREHAVNEMQYADNYLKFTTGLYIRRGGNGDVLQKTNYFNKADNTALSKDSGTGSTPIQSQVYIGATVSYGSEQFDTLDETNKHYNENYNPQKDNQLEYNYLTAFNLLQKFDADAYKPVYTDPVVDKMFELGSQSNVINGGAFRITTTETKTTWDSTSPYTTESYKLTILYAAKTDGTNWAKGEARQQLGGEADMDAHKEEDLVYFTSLQELENYFGYDENGEPLGRCVGILYEFRDCCIRTGRSVSANAKMQVTDEFERTGGTYCTTNDVRGWSTYRPTFKQYYSANGNKIPSDILYQRSWLEITGENRNGVTSYGAGNGELPGNYRNGGLDATLIGQYIEYYEDGYVKTEYEKGNKVNGTHTGWYAGNTLLLYTLTSEISIQNTDILEGSNRPKEYYNVSRGERTANFAIQPRLWIASEAKDHELVSNGSQATDVEIRLELPAGLHYWPGSISFAYGAEGCEYEDGDLSWDVIVESEPDDETDNSKGTVLILRTTVSDIEKGLPDIHYTCTIGTPGIAEELDVKSNTALVTKVGISTVYEERNQLAASSKTAQVAITPIRERDENIYKTVDRTLVELGDDLVYYLHYINHSLDPTDIELCDVLPYNGDGRNTEFGGAYRVTGLELEFEDEESYLSFTDQAGNGVLKYRDGIAYTSDSAGQKKVLDDAKNSGEGWSKIGVLETVPGDESAQKKWIVRFDPEAVSIEQKAKSDTANALYAVIPQIAANRSVVMKVVLSPMGTDNRLLKDIDNKSVQSGDNSYWNNFFYRPYTSEQNTIAAVTSSSVFIKTVSRSISGIVWMDRDKDGNYVAGTTSYESVDQPLGGIDVYLYSMDAPDGGYITDNGDGTWTQDGVTLGAKTIEGVIYYPVADVLGNLVGNIITKEDGRYSFDNLAAGNYYVIFQDDGGDYQAFSEPEKPLPFEKLSVTPVRYSGMERLIGGETDKAWPLYLNEDGSMAEDSQAGAASLSGAVIDVRRRGIQLPGLEEIQLGHYISNHWNCGLYYTDLEVEKQWLGTRNVPEGAKVDLLLEAQIKTDDGIVKSAWQEGVYCFEQTADGVTALKDGYALEKDAYTITSLPDELTVNWTLNRRYLQAEGAGGEICYNLSESAAIVKNGVTGPLNGYIMKVEQEDSVNGEVSLQAQNTGLLYNLRLRKESMTDQNPVVPNAQFTIYKDSGCTEKLAVSCFENDQVSGTDGYAVFENLEAGTYYIKETKAPTGYRLNRGIFEVTVFYQAAAGGQASAVPQVTVKQITDETTGKALSESEQIPVHYTVTPDPKTVDPAEPPAVYSIEFTVRDECIYELPKTGGLGVLWNMLAGMALLATGFWLFGNKKKYFQ